MLPFLLLSLCSSFQSQFYLRASYICHRRSFCRSYAKQIRVNSYPAFLTRHSHHWELSLSLIVSSCQNWKCFPFDSCQVTCNFYPSIFCWDPFYSSFLWCGCWWSPYHCRVRHSMLCYWHYQNHPMSHFRETQVANSLRFCLDFFCLVLEFATFYCCQYDVVITYLGLRLDHNSTQSSFFVFMMVSLSHFYSCPSILMIQPYSFENLRKIRKFLRDLNLVQLYSLETMFPGSLVSFYGNCPPVASLASSFYAYHDSCPDLNPHSMLDNMLRTACPFWRNIVKF